MANLVAQIHANLKTIAASTLGADYHELRDTIDLDQNDERTIHNGFAVRHGDAFPALENLVNAYSMDHNFEVVLTKRNPRHDKDTELQAALNELYSKADDLFVQFFQTKLRLPELVVHLFEPQVLEPEFYQDKAYAALRLQMLVRYRQSLLEGVADVGCKLDFSDFDCTYNLAYF